MHTIDQGSGIVTEYSLPVRNENQPVVIQTISLDDSSSNDWFGTTMSLYDHTLAISATGPGK